MEVRPPIAFCSCRPQQPSPSPVNRAIGPHPVPCRGLAPLANGVHPSRDGTRGNPSGGVIGLRAEPRGSHERRGHRQANVACRPLLQESLARNMVALVGVRWFACQDQVCGNIQGISRPGKEVIDVASTRLDQALPGLEAAAALQVVEPPGELGKRNSIASEHELLECAVGTKPRVVRPHPQRPSSLRHSDYHWPERP